MTLTYNNPLPISDAEWCELAEHPVVRENWCLDDSDGPRELAKEVYGVKFSCPLASNPFLSTDLFVLAAWPCLGADGDANNAALLFLREQDRGTLEALVLPFPKGDNRA